MRLIENFQFSQANLQDFVDCRRRFQLRYLQHIAWPAIESEPVLENERFLQQGARFHRMIQQHLLRCNRLIMMMTGTMIRLFLKNTSTISK